ncbi:class I SAM-dependent RNA methyltransferase [Curtobacterium ammoniigenes]|uniref:class I SAM-dependent RNA methyltransferase n=1 Tax=Curtobacterium ammoniigenes TaxID=395387 RepID=UPI00082D4DD2|nr:TRAM domain-containing protein [Curtobacterium ammoniigenes]
MGERTGTDVELEVGDIAHGGIAVARLDGRVVFVEDAIPGERVRARITDDRKRSFWRASAVEAIEPSPHRVEHVWSAASIDRDPADRAGGAEFGHIALAHQRALKAQVLVDAFARFAHMEVESLPRTDGPLVQAAPGDEDRGGLAWRTRVRLHVDETGTAGPFASRSHRVIPVADLPLATADVQAVAPLRPYALPGVAVVDVVAPAHADNDEPGGPSTDSGARLVIDDQAPTVITEQVGDRTFHVDDTGFWQVHRAAPSVLTGAIGRLVDRDRLDEDGHHLDLYGGVGLLAAALAEVVGPRARVSTIESAPRATEHAQENLAEWVGARAETARVDRWLRRTLAGASRTERERLTAGTVVLDPPRSGAGREVVESLVELAPAQIVYVACDPVALARDVGLFAEHGYRLDALEAHDLFPHTHHLEAVARLVPAA